MELEKVLKNDFRKRVREKDTVNPCENKALTIL